MISTRNSRNSNTGRKAAILTAFMATGLGGALGAHAQTAQLAANTVAFNEGPFQVGGLIQANGQSGGGASAATTAIAQETYATFILPTLTAGTQFSTADFSVGITNVLNTNGLGVFAQPDFSGNLVAAAGPASLVNPALMGQVLAIGTGGTPITTDAAGDEVDVTPNVDIAGQGYTDSVTGAAINSTFGDKIASTKSGTTGSTTTFVVDSAGNPVSNPGQGNGLFAGNPDQYHTTSTLSTPGAAGYANTVISDPLYLNTPSGEVPLATDSTGKPITSLNYQPLVSDFLTPSDYGNLGTIATGSNTSIAEFLNQAYQQYGAGGTVTFSIAPSMVADAPGTPNSAYVLTGNSEALSYTVGPAAKTAVVPEPSPLALLALGAGGLVLTARKRRAVKAA